MSLDLDKLIKVLGMTTSEHEGEALAALRMAVRMMATAKVTWADLLKPALKQGIATESSKPSYQHSYEDYFGAMHMNEAQWDIIKDYLRRENMRHAKDMQSNQSYQNPYRNWKDFT